VGELLEEAADQWGDREAVVSCQQGVRKTYSQVLSEADRLAAGMLAIGVNPGDRLGIWGPNSWEWYLTQMAAARLGAVLVNINPAYQPQELLYCLNKVGVKAIVAAERFKTQDYFSILEQVVPELESAVLEKVESEAVPSLSRVVMMGETRRRGALSLEQVMEAGGRRGVGEVQELQPTVDRDDPTDIQFTSGTTGNPKGATLSHHNIVNNAYMIGLRMGYHEKYARICCPPPLYHCLGCVIGNLNAVIHGGAMILPAASFDAAASVKAVAEEECTSLYGTPTMFIDILAVARKEKAKLPTLHTGLMAGAPCPEELCKAVVDELGMKDFVVAYGMTETSPVTFQGFPDDDMLLKTSTVGYPMDHQEVKVVDNEGKTVGVGEVGELCTRGYSTMLGYWGDDERTQEVLGKDGWMHTGDTAVITEAGYGKIVGRMKDMIIRGGENIYPREIEEFLHGHPAISEVQAIGVSDARLGEELAVWVRLNEDATGSKITEDEVRDFCRGKLAHFKIPRYVYLVDSFPTTVTGKVQKFKMREITETWLKSKNMS